MKEKPEFEDSISEFKRAFWQDAVMPWALPTLRWLDRQLRRWPWLYRRLS